MKKEILVFTLFSIMIIIACEKDNDNEIINNKLFDTLLIETNKTKYDLGENVIIELTNYYDSTASYYVCSSYGGIPPVIYKLEKNACTGFWAPICNGYTSFCCLGLLPGKNYIDTINIDFEKGKYKIEYSFIIEHGSGYKDYSSNFFIVE